MQNMKQACNQINREFASLSQKPPSQINRSKKKQNKKTCYIFATLASFGWILLFVYGPCICFGAGVL